MAELISAVLPPPVSPEEYPDDSFSVDYQTYKRRNPDGELTLSGVADIKRRVYIPVDIAMEKWEQDNFQGKINWNQETHTRVRNLLVDEARARMNESKS